MTYLRSTGAATASNTRFNLLGKLPAGAAALLLGVSAAAMMSGSAQAVCTATVGTFPIDGGNDDIDCGVLLPAVGVDALGGDDTITFYGPLIAGPHTGTYTGNTGNDTINFVTPIFNPLIVTGIIDGGDGNDVLNLTGGGLGVTLADVGGGNGDDTITLDGATVTDLHGDFPSGGGTGDDTIIVLSGVVTQHIDGDDGDDSITINGGNIAQVNGGGGEDFIDLNGGAITGSIFGEGDNDTILMSGGTVGGDIDGGGGDDFVQMTGGAVTGSVLGQSGNDIFWIDAGSVTGDVLGGSGDDYMELGFSGPAATITGNMDGGSGDDTLVVLDGSVANVLGGTDNDLINIFGGTVTSDVNGGIGDDTINLLGGTVTGNIVGSNGSDTINLLSGSVTGFVFGSGGGGDDTITLDGATVGLGIFSGTGNDTVDLLSGSTSTVSGQDGDDTITLDGATVTGEIAGDAGDDTINLTSGTVASVDGGLDNDIITLNGANVTGDIHGGDDDDIINLFAGTVGGDVLGDVGPGDDTITLAGADVLGSIDGEAGNDTININSGTVGVNVLGSAGEDLITVNGGMIGGNVGGGTENDVIALNGGTVGDSVFGGDDDDTITLNGTVVTNDLSGDLGDDVFTLTTGSFGRDLLGGLGSDTATIAATYSLASIVGNLDGGDDVSSADGFTDVLDIDASGTLTADNVINWEQIVINAGNTVVLEGAALVTGGGDGIGGNGISLGGFSTLDLDDGLAITGDFESFSALSTVLASTAGGTGVYSVSGLFLMDGTLDMSGPIPGVGDVFIVGGAYDSLGGSTLLDANLDATETADSLDLNGSVVGSPNFLTIFDQGGPPSFTGTGPGNGIVLVDASGGFGIDDGDFALNPFAHPGGEIVKVPFVYMLSLESDDILYLQSDVLAQVYGYAILAELMREDFPILRERLGDKRYNGFSGDGTDNSGAAGGGVGWDNGGIWARLEGTKRTNEHRGDHTTGEWEASRIEAEVGIDIPMNVGGGQGLFGISTHFIQGFADANSGLTPDPDVAEVDTTGFGAGLSFVYFPGGGFYADVQGRFTAWDADVEVDNRSIDQDINALGWGTSLEVGNRMAFGNTAVTPRGRAVYSDVSFESFTDDDGVKVKQEDSASVVVEGGVTVEQMFPDNGVTIFADASVSHDVLRDSAIDASGFTFDSGLEDTWGTVAIGGSMETGQGTSAFIAAEVSSPFGTSFGNSVGYGLRAGVRVDF